MNKPCRLIASLMLSTAFFANSSNVLAEPYQENLGNGNIDWASGEMNATGMGVPPERYGNSARGRMMALRAAKVDAMRNLLTTMKGVRIESQTMVKDMAVESDLIRSKLQGTLRGASVVGKPNFMDDGSVEVVMAINYRQSIAKVVLQQYGKNQAVKKSITPNVPVTPSTSVVTGLIIDAIGKGLKTALSPRILDEDGHVIYSGAMVSADKKTYIVAYDTSPTDAAKLPKMGDNSLTIKAIKVLNTTDVVISNHDAAKIAQAAGMQDTLRQARVAFAL